jgi:hypothetical protein
MGFFEATYSSLGLQDHKEDTGIMKKSIYKKCSSIASCNING